MFRAFGTAPTPEPPVATHPSTFMPWSYTAGVFGSPAPAPAAAPTKAGKRRPGRAAWNAAGSGLPRGGILGASVVQKRRAEEKRVTFLAGR